MTRVAAGPPADHRHMSLHRGTALARRAVRRSSSALRPLPNVLVVGGIRCGSTSLYRYLLDSGCTGPVGLGKEIHYFDANHHRGTNWLRACFPIVHEELVVDATPSYLCHPGTAARAAQTVPDARIVAILRHPARRAESHFAWRRRNGGEPLTSLAAAIADEPDRARAAKSTLGQYLLHSRYEVGIRSWTEHYGSDRVCVLVAERIFGGDRDELRRLHDFLPLTGKASFPHTNMGPGGTALEPEIERAFDPTIAAVEELIGRPTGWL